MVRGPACKTYFLYHLAFRFVRETEVMWIDIDTDIQIVCIILGTGNDEIACIIGRDKFYFWSVA